MCVYIYMNWFWVVDVLVPTPKTFRTTLIIVKLLIAFLWCTQFIKFIETRCTRLWSYPYHHL